MVKPKATAERILDEALRLFSTQGYAATTVGDIEKAAGLTPRAGAFYRHFRSKRAVLGRVVDHFGARLADFDELDGLLPLADLRSELTLVARWALRFLGGQVALLRLLSREAEQLPRLRRRVHERLVAPGYERTKAYFGRYLPARRLRGVAAIALGSIVHYVEDRAIYGTPPAAAGEAEFVREWVETWAAVIERR